MAAEARPAVARPGPLRVMVVDDHAFVRTAIAHAIASPTVEIVAEAGTAGDAIAKAVEVRPDVMLLDLGLPDSSGLHVLRELHDRLTDSEIVVLTVSDAPRDIHEAVRSGASGYLTKNLDAPALRRAVEGIRHGQLAMPRVVAAEAILELRQDWARARDGKGEHLTYREEEVLRLVADGLTDHEIADCLGVSQRTAEAHVSSILHKLGVRNRAQAARRYAES